MIFEVINNNGQVVMWTDSIECIPNTDELKAINNAGYRHSVNGRIIAYNKVDEMAGRTMPVSSKSHRLF